MEVWTDICFEKWDYLKQVVHQENIRQLYKWGIQTHSPFEWLTFLVEEVGELAQAISEAEYRDGAILDITKEAFQVATLALKIAEMSQEALTGKEE